MAKNPKNGSTKQSITLYANDGNAACPGVVVLDFECPKSPTTCRRRSIKYDVVRVKRTRGVVFVRVACERPVDARAHSRPAAAVRTATAAAVNRLTTRAAVPAARACRTHTTVNPRSFDFYKGR